MSEKDVLKNMGYGESDSFENIMFENAEEFWQKHSETYEKKAAFVDMNDTEKVEFEKDGSKYDDLKSFATKIGAKVITNELVSAYKSIPKEQPQTTTTSKETNDSNDEIKQLKAQMAQMQKEIKQKSITFDAQGKSTAGHIESGEPPVIEALTVGEKLRANKKAFLS